MPSGISITSRNLIANELRRYAEQIILDAVTLQRRSERPLVREPLPSRPDHIPGGGLRPARRDYVPSIRILRRFGDVMVESWLRDAPIRLNRDIAAGPDRADEVIYNLRAILLFVQVDGPARTNENFVTRHLSADFSCFGFITFRQTTTPSRRSDTNNPSGIG